MLYFDQIEKTLVVLSVEEGSSFTATLSFPPSFSYFEGHFHDEAILPAFMVVQVSVDLINKYLNRTISFYRISKSKFLKIIRPDELIKIIVTYDQTKNSFKIIWLDQDMNKVALINLS